MKNKIIFIALLTLVGCGQDVQFGKAPVVSMSAQNQVTPPTNPNPPSNSPSNGLLACPAPDGIDVCDPWVFIGFVDMNSYATGYMRRRTCNPAYDCRTLDHNGPCTQLNPLDEPNGPLIARDGIPSCDYIVH